MWYNITCITVMIGKKVIRTIGFPIHPGAPLLYLLSHPHDQLPHRYSKMCPFSSGFLQEIPKFIFTSILILASAGLTHLTVSPYFTVMCLMRLAFYHHFVLRRAEGNLYIICSQNFFSLSLSLFWLFQDFFFLGGGIVFYHRCF